MRRGIFGNCRALARAQDRGTHIRARAPGRDRLEEITMLGRWLFVGMIAGGAGCGGQSESAMQPASLPAPQSQSAEAETIIEPEADAALRRMSAYLADLKSFRVDTRTTDEFVTSEGQKIQFVKETRVAVRRPDKLSAHRIGPRGRVVLRYDGKQISVHGPELGVYAVERAPSDLKSMIDFARDRLEIDAPAGDLLLPDAYQELMDGVAVGRYIGKEQMGDVRVDHLAMTEKDVDWQLWIKDGPDPVPLRYVITTKSLPEQPQFIAELHDWRPNEPLSDEQFAFQPPAGATRMTFPELQKMKRQVRDKALNKQ
jgi:hypothetical protein